MQLFIKIVSKITYCFHNSLLFSKVKESYYYVSLSPNLVFKIFITKKDRW